MAIAPSQEIKLPCGCLIGSILCPEAQKLWDEIDRTFWNSRQLPDSRRQEYHLALDNFYEHFNFNREVNN